MRCSNHVEVMLTIPTHRVGVVIGKRGETIRQLQNRYDVRMHMLRDASQSNVGTVTLQIVGESNKVEAVKSVVNGIVLRNERASMSGMRESNETMTCGEEKDYTAMWAGYYRSMRLNSQALAIEQVHMYYWEKGLRPGEASDYVQKEHMRKLCED